MQRSLSITIGTGKEFTDHYLDHPDFNYGYKMIGYSYLIVAKIGNQLKVSDVTQLSNPAEVQTLEDKAKNAYNIIKTIGDICDDAKSGAVGITETAVSKGSRELAWMAYYHTLLENQDTLDNNNIIGG